MDWAGWIDTDSLPPGGASIAWRGSKKNFTFLGDLLAAVCRRDSRRRRGATWAGRLAPSAERCFARYSPRGSQSTDAALAELTEQQLLHLFRQSQPAWTSPESAYGAL